MKHINNVETLSLTGCDLGIDPSFRCRPPAQTELSMTGGVRG
jgi:hypothetical protein